MFLCFTLIASSSYFSISSLKLFSSLMATVTCLVGLHFGHIFVHVKVRKTWYHFEIFAYYRIASCFCMFSFSYLYIFAIGSPAEGNLLVCIFCISNTCRICIGACRYAVLLMTVGWILFLKYVCFIADTHSTFLMFQVFLFLNRFTHWAICSSRLEYPVCS